MNPNTLIVLDIMQAALTLAQQAQTEGRDVTPEELAGLSNALTAQLAAQQAAIDRMPDAPAVPRDV